MTGQTGFPRKTNADEQEVIALTSKMLHDYYCVNDVEGVISAFDDEMIWVGVGEKEYLTDPEAVSDMFRRFKGVVPKCRISDEEYSVLTLAPDVYVCSGRLWIATDPSTQISLRVHQRITLIFRRREGRLRCCHIHISNPYSEMSEEDIGFPTKMAQQSYRYLQEQVEEQKRQIIEQTELFKRMSYIDTLTQLYNRNKFNEVLQADRTSPRLQLGIACMDLNGLKRTNDEQGHAAGDDLIRRAAEQIRRVFDGQAYRIGGDEFVVIDDVLSREEFISSVYEMHQGMEENHVSCAIGISWRSEYCNMEAQLDEADHCMYEQKKKYYASLKNGWEG